MWDAETAVRQFRKEAAKAINNNLSDCCVNPLSEVTRGLDAAEAKCLSTIYKQKEKVLK